jgi:hypothetical protein
VLTCLLVDPCRGLPLVDLGPDETLHVLIRQLAAHDLPDTDPDRGFPQRQALSIIRRCDRFGVVKSSERGSQHGHQGPVPLLERARESCPQALSHVDRHRSKGTGHAVR